MLLVAGLWAAHATPASAGTGAGASLPRPSGSETPQRPVDPPGLDGRGFDGSIRARGLMGLVSVEGRIDFRAGQLVWSARGQHDAGAYTLQAVADGWRFHAEHALARGERVQWTGHFDGHRIRDVLARWQRQPGDWVHDLLLPEVVTLVFTPRAAAEPVAD